MICDNEARTMVDLRQGPLFCFLKTLVTKREEERERDGRTDKGAKMR